MTWSCGVIHLIIAELHCFQHWPQACHPQSSQRWLHKQTQAMVNQGNEDLVGCSPDGSSHCRPYSKACHRASSPRHSQNWLWATVNQVSVDQAESFQGDSWHCRRHSWEYHLEGSQHRFHTPNQQMHRAGRRSWSHCCISLVHQSHLIGRSQQQYPPGQWDSTIKMTQYPRNWYLTWVAVRGHDPCHTVRTEITCDEYYPFFRMTFNLPIPLNLVQFATHAGTNGPLIFIHSSPSAGSNHRFWNQDPSCQSLAPNSLAPWRILIWPWAFLSNFPNPFQEETFRHIEKYGKSSWRKNNERVVVFPSESMELWPWTLWMHLWAKVHKSF